MPRKPGHGPGCHYVTPKCKTDTAPSSLRKAVDSYRKTGSKETVEKGNVEEDNEIALQNIQINPPRVRAAEKKAQRHLKKNLSSRL